MFLISNSYRRIAPVERKRHLLKMLLNHQDLFVKLSQLLKWLPWLRHSLNAEKALDVVNKKGLLFTEAADTMAQMNGAMQHYRLPSIPIRRTVETMLGIVGVPHALQRLIPDAEAMPIDDGDLALFTRRVAMKTLEGIPSTMAFGKSYFVLASFSHADGPNVSLEEGDWCLSLRVYPSQGGGDGAKWHLENVSCSRLVLSKQIKATLQQAVDVLQTQSTKLNLTKLFATLWSCQRHLMLRKFIIDLQASFSALSLPLSLSKDNKLEDTFLISSSKEHLSEVIMTIDSDGLICLSDSTNPSSSIFDDQAISKVIDLLWETWRKHFLTRLESSLAPYRFSQATDDSSILLISHKLLGEHIPITYDLATGILSIPNINQEPVKVTINETNSMKQTLKQHVAKCLLGRLAREDLIQVKRESIAPNEILLAFVECPGSYIHCLLSEEEDQDLSYIEVRRFGNLSNPIFKYSLGNIGLLSEVSWNVVNQRLQMRQIEDSGFLLVPKPGNHATDDQIWIVVNAPVVFPILRVQISMKPNHPITLQILIRKDNEIQVIDRHLEQNSLQTLGELAKTL